MKCPAPGQKSMRDFYLPPRGITKASPVRPHRANCLLMPVLVHSQGNTVSRGAAVKDLGPPGCSFSSLGLSFHRSRGILTGRGQETLKTLLPTLSAHYFSTLSHLSSLPLKSPPHRTTQEHKLLVWDSPHLQWCRSI